MEKTEPNFKQMRIKLAKAEVEKRVEWLKQRKDGQRIIDKTYETFKTLKRVENRRLANLARGKLVSVDCYVDHSFDGNLLMALARAHPDFRQSIQYSVSAREMIVERLEFQTTNNPLYRKIAFPEEKKEPPKYVWTPETSTY
jgi:hypothetical protein